MSEQIEQREIDFADFYFVFLEQECVAAFQHSVEANIFARERLTLMDWQIMKMDRKPSTDEPDLTLADMACGTCN